MLLSTKYDTVDYKKNFYSHYNIYMYILRYRSTLKYQRKIFYLTVYLVVKKSNICFNNMYIC